jgi:hypothetical protein
MRFIGEQIVRPESGEESGIDAHLLPRLYSSQSGGGSPNLHYSASRKVGSEEVFPVSQHRGDDIHGLLVFVQDCPHGVE